MRSLGITAFTNRTRVLMTAAALAAGVVGLPSADAAINIMPLGDSITFGQGSSNGNGYRGPLQSLLNNAASTYDFVGALQDGTVDIDPDHYGIPGIKAHDFGNVNKSLLRQLGINSVFPTLDYAREYPDKVLLHIGTNTFNGGGGGNPAGTELDFLLQGLTTTNTASDFYIGADGNHEIILARILPKAGNTTAPNTDGGVYTALTQHQARVKSSFDYNYGGASNPHWANGIESIATSRSQYNGRITLVDMFRIDVDSLNLQVLLDDFGTALSITTVQEMRDILSPEDDTLNPGNASDWVDWVLNYDEVNNTFGGGTDGVNTDLYAPSDTIHPGDLGYAVMAQVWFNGGFDLVLGDITGDGFVGLEDLSIILNNWDASGVPGDPLLGDLDRDGLVGLTDLTVVLNNWNAGTYTPPAVAVVPEPAGMAAMLVLGGAILRRVR